MRALTVVIVLLLAGCGGGGEEPRKQATPTATTTKPAPKPAPKPTIALPTGKAAPEALSQFLCAKDAKGVWNASGTIANSGKSKATFQVTVYVGEAAGSDERAMTKQLASIQAGGSAKFALTKVPAPKAGGPCHVQVLRR
ncbi:MAG: hypothetical protein ABIZ34_00110 [Candidatus Limnocylindrales bacterium]